MNLVIMTMPWIQMLDEFDHNIKFYTNLTFKMDGFDMN